MSNSHFDILSVFISNQKHFINFKWMACMQYMIY
jgi:hypothetical protein